MAFIVSKKSSRNGRERELYYLVENYRKDNKVRRKTLLKLNEHKTVAELLTSIEQERIDLVDRLHKFEKERDDFINHGKAPPLSFGSPYMIRKRLEWAIKNTKTQLKACEKKIEEIKKHMQN